MSADAPAQKYACDLSIIVVSHDTRAATMQCLSALPSATEGLTTEVVVVDNASTDGSAEAIGQHDTAPWLISCGVHHGFRKAAVLGATMAMGRYVLVLKSDVVPHAGAITRLVTIADRAPGPGVWGGRIVAPDHGATPHRVVTASTVSDAFMLVSAEIWPTLCCFDRPTEPEAPLVVWAGVAHLLGHSPRLVPEAVAVASSPVATAKPALASPSLTDALRVAKAAPGQPSWLPWRRASTP